MCSLTKEHPAPLLWPNFSHRVKVYSNECPTWSKLHVEYEKHSYVVSQARPWSTAQITFSVGTWLHTETDWYSQHSLSGNRLDWQLVQVCNLSLSYWWWDNNSCPKTTPHSTLSSCNCATLLLALEKANHGVQIFALEPALCFCPSLDLLDCHSG